MLLGMFALGVDAYVMAGILPSIAEDFRVSIGVAGQTVSVFTLCYAIAAPVFATFMSKTNAKYTLVYPFIDFKRTSGDRGRAILAISLISIRFLS